MRTIIHSPLMVRIPLSPSAVMLAFSGIFGNGVLGTNIIAAKTYKLG
jgi:hypothetical protein